MPLRERINCSDVEQMELMQDRFKACDRDGNGTLDREELRLLLGSMGREACGLAPPSLEEAELEEIMQSYDSNQSGVIDLDEFDALCYDALLLGDLVSWG